MMFSMSGTPVYAADMETGASAVCPHHVHDETCGYSEGTPCTHEHTDDCYTLVTQCVHEHTAECYSDGMLPAEGEEKAADACTHVCSEESGCITKELNCPHVHDETCGYSEGSPCTFDPSDCELCNPTDSGEPEGPAECTCETLCTADSVNPDCPVCSAEGADLTACAGTVEEGDAAPQTVTAWAVEGDVTYLYYDTNTKTWQTGTISSGDYTTASFTASSWGTAGNTTWYVANSTGNIAGRNTIQVNGDVRLILAAGSNISLIDIPLNITDGSSLTIYGQDSSSGRLSVTPFSGSAITLGSGSSLTIHSGNLTLQTGLATGISVGSGTLVNQSNGTITGDGDTNGVTIRYEPTVTVTSQSAKDTNVADKNEENVIFTATVSDRVGAPTGSVQFKKDDTNLGDPVTLNDGTATCTVSASTLGLGDHSITAVYTPADGSSYTGKTGALTFRVVGGVTGITVTSQPTKTEYKTGDNLDLTGLEITVSYEGSDTYKPVLSWGAEGITASPDNGTVLQSSAHNGKAVTITYEGKTATTATLAVYETPQQTDGVYQIGTAGELFWFAALVNGTLEGMAQNTAANAVLTADIDLGGSKWTPIAPSATFKNDATSVEETTDKSYSGTFDGQGHTISNFEIRTNSAEKTSGLFGTVTGTIQNLGIVDASFDNGGDYDGRFGALCGLLAKDDDIETAATIQNCYVVGSSIAATGKIAGAVCGANYGGTIKDCYECDNTVTAHNRIGHLVGDNQKDYNHPIASWLTLKGTVTNCYSDTKVVGNQGGKVNGGGVKDAGAFASGEVAYLLNGSSSDSPVWYQNLDNGQTVDSYPVLDSSHGTVYCIEGDPASYSNDPNGNPAQVISVDITWGELSFTYSDGTWNPDTHTYDGAGWNVDEEGGNSIKVENTGNTDVNVTYEYKAEETGITGSFTDGENPVSTPVALPANNSSTVYLILAGKPGKELEKAIIGCVTVTIGGESE